MKSKIIKSGVAHPINDIGGFYVTVQHDAYPKKADTMNAARLRVIGAGYNFKGETRVGIPVKEAPGVYTQTVWFFDKK